MLTTSEHNYKRSLFSFQQSCINQSETQSIGIHLKRKISDKKTKQKSPKTNFYSAQVRKTSLIVHSGFKTIKKPPTARATGTACAGSLCSGAVSTNHSGEVFPMHQSFPRFTVGEMVHEQQTGANEQDIIILSPTQVVSLTQEGCGRCRRK